MDLRVKTELSEKSHIDVSRSLFNSVISKRSNDHATCNTFTGISNGGAMTDLEQP